MSTPEVPRVDRRTAVKWMLTAAAGAVALGRTPLAWGATPARATQPSGQGYGTDPDLTKEYKPGDLWPLTLSDEQRRVATALCGFIIPADSESPSAATLGVQDFIDEWISAPYPDQKRDRPVILEGLDWMDAEAERRFEQNFADLDRQQMAVIADEICHAPDAKPAFASAAKFFARFRDLTAGGFYTTPEGMKDLKYIGNTPLPEFKGPPPEVLALLGLS
jgi:hypothetical protein